MKFQAIPPRLRFVDNNGNALVGGKVYTYAAGTTTPVATYTDSTGSSANTNPVILDSRGEADFWLTENFNYKFVTKDSADNTIDTTDNIFNGNNGTRVSLEKFNCVGDGVTDDTVNFQSAATAAAAAHAILEFGSGKEYLITDTIAVTANYMLWDMQGATIKLSDASGVKSHVKFGDGGSTQYAVCWIYGHGIFTRVQAATAGAAIECDHAALVDIRDLRIYGDSKIFRGIYLKRVIYGKVVDCNIEHTVSNGIYAFGTGTGADQSTQIEIRDNHVSYAGAAGIETYDFCEGFYVHHNIIYACAVSGITFSASVNANGLFSFRAQHNDLDTGGGKGLYLQHIDDVDISGNWISNNAGDGVHVDANATSVIIDGNQVYGTAGQRNFRIAGDRTVITGNVIGGGADGIYFEASADTSEVATNVIASQTGYGINVILGPSNVSIGPNVFSGNAADVSSGTSAPTIASADPLPITSTSDVFIVSGNTSFGGLSGGYAGRRVTLIFSGTPTVFHSAGGATTMYLTGASNFTAAAESVLNLHHNGTRWYQI